MYRRIRFCKTKNNVSLHQHVALVDRGPFMNPFLQRRLTVANCWATTRIALLDGNERYEDSYAITQEFREWITSIGDHPDHLEDSVLMVPQTFNYPHIDEATETDEMLEI